MAGSTFPHSWACNGERVVSGVAVHFVCNLIMCNAVDCRLTEMRWPFITKMNYRPEPVLNGANQRGSAYRQTCLCLVTPSACVNVTVLKTASCCYLLPTFSWTSTT